MATKGRGPTLEDQGLGWEHRPSTSHGHETTKEGCEAVQSCSRAVALCLYFKHPRDRYEGVQCSTFVPQPEGYFWAFPTPSLLISKFFKVYRCHPVLSSDCFTTYHFKLWGSIFVAAKDWSRQKWE
jgi:hypothetical protein